MPDCRFCSSSFIREVNIFQHERACSLRMHPSQWPQATRTLFLENPESLFDNSSSTPAGNEPLDVTDGDEVGNHHSVDNSEEDEASADDEEGVFEEDFDEDENMHEIFFHDLGLNDNMEDVFGLQGNAIIQNACTPVDPLQYRAAFYIVCQGTAASGLSKQHTQDYLELRDPNDSVLQLWSNSEKFWADHERRLKEVLFRKGRWLKKDEKPPRKDVPTYTALIRDIIPAIQHVLKSAASIDIGSESWENILQYQPTLERNEHGERIIFDWFSADDACYITKALRLKSAEGDDELHYILPMQLFIDKANVTRLNRRSMYPIVLYLLCFPRKMRRLLAINVGFIPLVSKYSVSGRRLSDAVIKTARSTVLQETLRCLLAPVRAESVDFELPSGQSQSITPLLASIIADVPEVAVIMSCRYGTKTQYPCPRCFQARGQLGSYSDMAHVKRSSDLVAAYQNISRLPTQTRRHQYLKLLSLRLPKSFLLERDECNLDSDDICAAIRGSANREVFGFSSVLKYEAMHNLDLGITADLLRSIGSYYSVCIGKKASNKLVDKANFQQALLPRRIISGFRLPKIGETIADTHANVNAYQYMSALCVLPFILLTDLDEPEAEALFPLLKLVLSYIRLHHYIRRINLLPWHTYSNIESDIANFIEEFTENWASSLGRTINRSADSEFGAQKVYLDTIKGHLLFRHLVSDIKGGGNVQQFDAQAGESHHRLTRAHFGMTSKREDADINVAKRSAGREVRVFDEMYPCVEPVHRKLFSIENNDDHELRAGRGTRTTLSTKTLDGLKPEDLRYLLLERFPDPYYVFREDFRVLEVIQTISINCRYPLLPERLGTELHPALENVHGLQQPIRASSSFYRQPMFSFVEIRLRNINRIGQVRLIFSQPYEDKRAASGRLLCLVRLMRRTDLSMCISNERSYWEYECKRLLIGAGCYWFEWDASENGKHGHAVISIRDILRPVVLEPDFSSPIGAEEGTKYWQELLTEAISSDEKRYKREKRQRERLFARWERLGRDVSSIPPVPSPRSLSDEFVPSDDILSHRFFLNDFLPWTRTKI